MENFILIAVCVLAGMLFNSTKLLPADSYKALNAWVLYLALPAVALTYLPKIDFTIDYLFPVVSIFIVILLSNIYMKYYSKRKGYSARSRSTLEMSAAYSNASFVGFPLVMAFFGKEYLAIAVICDQTNFLGVSTVGLVTALRGGTKHERSIKAKFILKRLFTFPPFLGCIVALGLAPFIDFSPTEPFFSMIADTVAPMALFSIGLQLKFRGWKKLMAPISVSMLYKLLLAPALVVIMALIIGIKGDIPKITVFETAMPTLVSSSIIAEQFGLNTKLLNLIIGISLITAFATLPLWYPIINYLF